MTSGNTTVALVVLLLIACALAAAALWRLVQIRRRLRELHLRLTETEARLVIHTRAADEETPPPPDPFNGGPA